MKEAHHYAGIGIFFLLGVSLLYLSFNALTTDLQRQDDGYTIRAYFDDVLQLRRGDSVRMAGVVIGVVTGTELEGRRALARLQIRPEYEIPADSSAIINMAGLLGTNYIAVDMGESSQVLGQDDEIRTRESFDINDAMEEVGDIAGSIGMAIDGIQSALGGENGQSVFQQIGGLISENSGRIGDSLENIRTLTGRLAAGEGTIGQLLVDGAAYRELLDTFSSIRVAANDAASLIQEAQGVVAGVRGGNGTLGVLLSDEDTAGQVRALVANIAAFSERLSDAESTIGRLLGEDDLYEEVRSVVRKANRTLDSLSDSAPISAVGVAVSGLF